MSDSTSPALSPAVNPAASAAVSLAASPAATAAVSLATRTGSPVRGLTIGSMLARSLRHRRARSLSALVALTVSATLATALLTLRADLDAKLHREFRAFGANVVVTDDSRQTWTAEQTGQVRQLAGSEAQVAPIAYAVATSDRNTPVVVAGVDFAAMRRLNTWWTPERWPAADNEALLGQKAAGFIANEQLVTLTYAGKPLVLHGVGQLKTGGDEDGRVYMSLPAFTAWTGVGAQVLELQVPGGAARVDEVLDRLRQVPGVHAEPVRQMIAGESAIVDKTHALVGGAVLLIGLTVCISVLSTLSASVLERRRDFALMKALGASQRQLLGHFLLEALTLSGVALVLGIVLGWGVAWGIGELNFGTAILPRLPVLPLVLLLNLTIAVLAAALPARALRALEPAALLKGE